MPPTRREQLELDELLSDIYRGIETLPDKSAQSNVSNHYHATSNYNPSSSNSKTSKNLYSRSYIEEYELPASSPLVRQHKQELAALRNPNYSNSQSAGKQQPQRSTLKRHTNTPDQHQPQSLASFVTSTTPDNKRRVRIVDHPDKVARGYSSDEEFASAERRLNNSNNSNKVKYVNTNKLIYHQERDPDDDELSDAGAGGGNNSDSDDDIDGKTRVEFYHTTWLDRQLGRASKRRSSKELNERQVKEKAMIEELKRSLKNGAITLRQSFKSKKNDKNKPSETYDDQVLDPFNSNNNNHHHRHHHHNRVRESTVIGSGLATVPRNYHQNSSSQPKTNQTTAYKQQRTSDTIGSSNTLATPKQTTVSDNYKVSNFDTVLQPVTQSSYPSVATTAPMPTRYQEPASQTATSNYSSRTLPHNYQQPKRNEQHQLLQSHYRGGANFNQTSNTINSTSSRPLTSAAPIANSGDTMRNGTSNGHYGAVRLSPTGAHRDHHYQSQELQQQPTPLGNTISSIPSPTEVVKSALSRSNSQISINQLNKTINLLPNSPPPYIPTPTTPTQQLKPASPSLSPSPIGSPYQQQPAYNYSQTAPSSHYASKPGPQVPQQQQQPCLTGTRVVTKTQTEQTQPQYQYQQQRQSQQQQQPVYANPHASLMQHRAEQQMRQPGARNTASIREFNELDSLLRSLSPGTMTTTTTTTSTQITPGYTTTPNQPAFGYGFTPAQPRQQLGGSDIYAKVQKAPQVAGNAPVGGHPSEQSKASYLQQHYGVSTQSSQPYTIDVTDRREENCEERQNLSEFEPPIDLLPSMEDYQNISKLNPVKNHYWYKPNMSRDRAIELLKDKPQGTFIVRDSTSFKGAYGLAVKVSKLPKNVLNNASLRNPNADPSAELIRHFLIEPTSNGVRLKGYANEPVFGSLPSLIYQHSLTELALPCRLLIPRADIEDPRFKQKQKQFFDEFIASQEQAKHSPYEITTPNGGYRKYPGDVYVHNEHRIIFE